MTIRRRTRTRPLTPEESATYRTVRAQVDEELPELVARHHQRMETADRVESLVQELKAARVARGLSLADLTRITGMDRSSLSKLETGKRPNPTVDTLARYAEAVGKRLVLTLQE